MLVRHALGPGADALDVEIRSVRPWTMNALVAEAYSKNILAVESCSKSAGRVDAKDGDAATAEEGRGGPGMKAEGSVFVVGDAAHQFPPAGGFGLNTGVQVTCYVGAFTSSCSMGHLCCVFCTCCPCLCLFLFFSTATARPGEEKKFLRTALVVSRTCRYVLLLSDGDADDWMPVTQV